MAAWMAYAALVGMLLWAGAMLLERLFRSLGMPTRWVWLLAIACSVTLPLVLLLPGVDSGTGDAVGGGSGYAGVAQQGAPSAAIAAGDLAWLDPLLVTLWALGSLSVVAILARSAETLRRRSRGWRLAFLAGVPVRVSADTGPAVLGFTRASIVVPGWVRELDESSQRLLVAHEREHLTARDPLLLLLGTVAVAILPWSPGIWLQIRALRQAMEVDCDRRVLRTMADHRRYGALLLEVAERIGRDTSRLALLSMARPPLERRIRILAGAEPVLGVRAGALHLGAASGLLIILAGLPAPPPPALDPFLPRLSAPAPPLPVGSSAEPRLEDSRPQLLNRHQAPAILERVYPDRLRRAGVGGTVVLWGYVGTRGVVEWTSVASSSGHPELDTAAELALRDFSFRPAIVDGRATASWTEQPITFLPPPLSTPASDAFTSTSSTARLAIWRSPAPAGSTASR